MNRGETNRNIINRETEVSQLRETAVNAVVRWAQTGKNELTMRSTVNRYMEVSGANLSIAGEEGIIGKRRIEAQLILRDCITPLSRENLRKAETMLFRIAEDDAPTMKRGLGR